MTPPVRRRLGIATASLALVTSACTLGSTESSDVGAARSDAITEVTEVTDTTAGTTADTTASIDTAGQSVELGGPPWTFLGTYEQQGIRRDYVLVDAGLTDAEIVAIVDELRALADAENDPDADFIEHFLMDDDSQFATILEELPNTAAGDTSGWPIDYVTEHSVARSQAYFVPGDDGSVERQYWLCRNVAGCDVEEALAVYAA